MIISDVYRSFIPNKTTFTTYCLTQWISNSPGSFESHWVRQYPGKFHGSGRHSSLGHGKLSEFLTLPLMIFRTCMRVCKCLCQGHFRDTLTINEIIMLLLAKMFALVKLLFFNKILRIECGNICLCNTYINRFIVVLCCYSTVCHDDTKIPFRPIHPQHTKQWQQYHYTR